MRSLIHSSACAALVLACNQVAGIEAAPDRPTLGPGECTTHADCLAVSGEYMPDVCVSGHCVPLLTEECPLALPQTDEGWLKALRQPGPQALIVGAYSMLSPSQFDEPLHNYDLGLSDLANKVGGLPAGNKTRPLIALACYRDYPEPEDLDTSADHLIDELEVPAILDGLFPLDSQHVFERSGHDRHVLFLTPYDPVVTNGSPDDGLRWSILPPITDLAGTYVPLLKRTLEHLVATGALGDDEEPRIAMVRTTNMSSLDELASAIDDHLMADKLGIFQPSRSNFLSVSVQFSPSGTGDYSSAITALEEFGPHVVIGVTASELTSAIIPALEAFDDSLRPFYIVSYQQAGNAAVPNLFNDFPDVRGRIAGVNYSAAEDPTVFNAYQADFRSTFPDPRISSHYENAYDAIYYLMYAGAVAAKDLPVTGSDLVAGLRHLLSGHDSFNVGPEDLRAGFKALATKDSSITLNGTMGPPNFDPSTGGRHMPGSVFCYDKGGAFYPDVLRMVGADIEATELTGEFSCFDFGTE